MSKCKYFSAISLLTKDSIVECGMIAKQST